MDEVYQEAARSQRFRRHIVRLWLGQVLSGLGDRLNEVALVWIAVQALGERAGWVVAAGTAGRLLFGLPGGVLADRLDRQWAMIACDLGSALAVLTLALADLSGPGALWHLAAVAFCVGTLDALFQPALQASLPAIAPDLRRLQAANAWLDVTRRLAVALGPSATGLLLAVLPLQQFFSLDAATFVVSALVIASLGRRYAWRPRAAAGAPRRSVLHEIAEAGRQVAGHRMLAIALGQTALWNLLLSPALQIGVALLVREEFGAGPALLGYATGAYGVGNVASNLVLARLPARHTARVLHRGALVAALGWIAVSRAPDATWLLGLLALTAIGGPMTDLMLLRVIQTEFPPERIGRIYSFRFTISRSSNALGLALAVPLYAALGVRAAIALGGIALATYASLALLRIRLREARPGP